MSPPRYDGTEKTIQQLTHQLGNSLSSILGFTELLLRNKLDDPIRRDLQKIHDEAMRMRDILHAAQQLKRK